MSQQTVWEADKMLDVYIYDYLMKKNRLQTAKAFQAEGKVSTDPVAIDAPGGFLLEWWSVFWDIYISRTDGKHSDTASSYLEHHKLIKDKEEKQQNHHQQQQQQKQQLPQQQHQIQMPHTLIPRHAQQQQQRQQFRGGANISSGSMNGVAGADALTHQNPVIANALATKLYEEQLKMPLQRDSLEESSMKYVEQRLGEHVGQLLDANHASMIRSAASSGLPPGQILHGSASMGGTLQQIQARSLQFSGSGQAMKNELNLLLNSRTDGSLTGVPGSNQGGNNLTLKGWPLTGLDQLRSGILPQKSLTVSGQQFNQLQFLSPQQQQLLLQNLASSSSTEIDGRRLRMLPNNRNIVLGKDGLSNVVGDIIPNVGSPMQAACSVSPHTETDMIKKIAQIQQRQLLQSCIQQQPCQQQASSSQQSQNSHAYLQEKIGAVNVPHDGNMLNTCRSNVQTPKSQTGRKRKHPGPATSSGTVNTAGPSPSSAPSTPSTHNPGDVMALPHNGNSSKPFVFGMEVGEHLASPSHQLAEMDRLVEDGSLDDNVESFLSHDDADPRDGVCRSTEAGKNFTFSEFKSTRASTSKVVCCHFSPDGKLLASGGHEKKAVLWYADTLKLKSTLDEHTSLITDVRFSSSMPHLATSSFDKTVRVWDADNPGYSLRTFMGHSASVMSLDFHPNKDDLICSCDSDGEIRYWSINNGSCSRIFEGGTTQIRFQPRFGRYLAAAAENVILILDVETQICQLSLQGHSRHVHSVCWDFNGDYLASVSEDCVKIWSLRPGSEGECVHHLSCNGNKFHSCVFHPTYPSVLVIGCYESLELWDMKQSWTLPIQAHDGLIASLAVSNITGVFASASHDKFIKLWR